jgi:hypothetical protein
VAGDAPAKDAKDAFDGIDTTWNRLPGGAETGRILAEAVRTFEPDHPERTIPLLLKARAQIATIHDPWASDKLVELNEAIALCAGLWLDANTDSYAVAPGATVEVGYTALNRSVFPMVLDSLTLEGMGGASRTDAHRAPLESNQPVNAQLKFAVPADQPYSQPFWLREPKQGDTYTISDQRMVGLPDDPPLLNLRFGLEAGGVAFVEPAAGRGAVPLGRRAPSGDPGTRGCAQGGGRCASRAGRGMERGAGITEFRTGASGPTAGADLRGDPGKRG